jgi:sulfate permease, SulP family
MKAVLGLEVSAFGKAATIALLNLSLVLSLGSLSATPIGQSAVATAVVAAFIATTLGGLLVALFARAPAEIAGAASSTTMIYAALAAELVARAGPQANLAEIWAALSVTVMLAGIFVAIAGYARLAGAIKFMPTPVNAGFVTGLGIAVAWSQAGPVLGLDARLASYPWAALIAQVKPASAVVGAVTALVLWSSARIIRRCPPALVALAAGTALYYAIWWGYGPRVLGPTLGAIAPAATAPATIRAVWGHFDPAWVASTALHVAPYAAFIALQIMMNAALASAAVGSLLGTRSDVDRTVKATGWTNILCGALGALPVTTIGSIALPAARMKGVTPAVAAVSCAMLFFGVVFAGDVLTRIPVAVLAGILIMGGVAMIDRWALGLIRTLSRSNGRRPQVLWNAVIVAAVAATFVFGTASVALFVGAVLAMILLAVSLSESTTFESSEGSALASTRVWPAQQAQWLAEERRHIALFRPRGSLFFGTADQLASRLDGIGAGVQFVVLDLARVTTIDATGCQIIAAAAKKLSSRGVATVLAGAVPGSARAQEWRALGLTQPDPATHWLADVDHALEWIELALLRDRWTSLDTQAADLAATPVTEGLSASDVEELRGYMKVVEVPAGALFRRGDSGASMFVVDSGFVEIRIASDAPASATRLAAFGPGSIFGEVAMLNAEERTADAVCMEPSRLYELRRDALAELSTRSPALYTRIMENLNRHLAHRLVQATAIVQKHQ